MNSLALNFIQKCHWKKALNFIQDFVLKLHVLLLKKYKSYKERKRHWLFIFVKAKFSLISHKKKGSLVLCEKIVHHGDRLLNIIVIHIVAYIIFSYQKYVEMLHRYLKKIWKSIFEATCTFIIMKKALSKQFEFKGQIRL